MTHREDRRAPFAVATHALAKRYGRETALAGVDLRVPDGAVYVLVGANGAGKSTTLKVLMNLERADSGTAAVFGLDTARRGPEVRARVGYVPEGPGLPHRGMTCAALLRHAAPYFPAWDDEYAARLATALGVRASRRLGGLSKGEARSVQLVLALAHRPPLLLLDEPTDGLDPLVRRRALALLAEHLADAPTTVVISTHHVHELESLADHVGVLRDGRLAAQLPREALLRTVRRYDVDVPDGWAAPTGLRIADARRSAAGRALRLTIVGDERDVARRLVDGGAAVREATTLSLEDAALAFLEERSA